MSQLFISHSSRDKFAAQAVVDWLRSEGFSDIFFDLDPRRGIAAGERWERALNQAAFRCEAVVFLVSKNWLGSEWCRKEHTLARGKNKALFSALIDETLAIADLPQTLTDTWQVADLAHGVPTQTFRTRLPGSNEEQHVHFAEMGLVRLRNGLQRAGLDPKYFEWPPSNEPDRPPYPGFTAFEAQDAGIFFGREAPLVEAMDKLRGQAFGGPPLLHVLLGASGAGKSSVLSLHVFMEPRGGELRLKGRAVGVVLGSDGKPKPAPPPEPSNPQRWLSIAAEDDLLADALTYFARGDDWFDIFKALECLFLRFGGGEKEFLDLDWADAGEITRLKRTANFERHARRKFVPPPRPMGRTEARDLLAKLMARAFHEADTIPRDLA